MLQAFLWICVLIVVSIVINVLFPSKPGEGRGFFGQGAGCLVWLGILYWAILFIARLGAWVFAHL
jgi:hypothetical protein